MHWYLDQVVFPTYMKHQQVKISASGQELGSDLVSYGYVTTTITVADPDRRTVDEHIRIAERIVNGRGFTAIRETLNAVDA